MKMYQYIIMTVYNEKVFTSLYFYESTKDVEKDFNSQMYVIIDKADWTEINI